MAVVAGEDSATGLEGQVPSQRQFAHRASWGLLVPLAVVLAYSVALLLVVLRHEPWFDEAQAWLLARDSDPWSLFTKNLPYEGSPGLWHALLMVPSRLLPYASLNFISAGFGILATYLFVRHSPFPAFIKAVFPFTYFVFYQYAVVARNYSLLAPLLFSVAMWYPRKEERVGAFTVLLILLANVSAHATIMAGGIMGLHLIDLFLHRKKVSRQTLMKNVAAIGVFAFAVAALAFLMKPPSDRSFAPEGATYDFRVFWETARDMLNASLTESRLLTALVVAASVVWFWRSKTLLLWLIPTVGILAFSAFVYRAAWHEGTIFLFWVFALWVSLDKSHKPIDKQDASRDGRRDRALSLRASLWSRRAVLVAMLLVAAVQLSWSYQTSRFDYEQAYSGSEELAQYIQANRMQNSRIFGTGFSSVAVLPYFGSNIYSNYHDGRRPSFWLWSSRNDMIQDSKAIIAQAPDFIVVGVKVQEQYSAHKLFPGYQVKRVFHGNLFWKHHVHEPDSYLLLERA